MEKLLIKNGKLINEQVVDIFIENGKIMKIAPSTPLDFNQSIVDLEAKYYVSAGWIDMHTHCYPEWDLYYDDADEIGYKTGVTTVVDAGSCGSANIGRFCELNQDKITNVYAFLNIADTGICAQNELSDLSQINFHHIEQVIQQYPHIIVGLKARMSASVIGDNGIRPLELAAEIKEKEGLPLMVHCGSAPPNMEDILRFMGKNTILTHCFHGKPNGILDTSKNLKTELVQALQRGMILDIGHGKESFDMNVARWAKEQGVYADIISTDIYQQNRIHGPVYDLATTASKLLSIGYPLEKVIDGITCRPAATLGLHRKGKLEVRYDADLTIFSIDYIEKNEIDSKGQSINIKKSLKPFSVVINGQYCECK